MNLQNALFNLKPEVILYVGLSFQSSLQISKCEGLIVVPFDLFSFFRPAGVVGIAKIERRERRIN